MPARYAVYYAPSAGDALHQAVTPLLGTLFSTVMPSGA